MISLMLALLAADPGQATQSAQTAGAQAVPAQAAPAQARPPAPATDRQSIQAPLQGCAMEEGGRWVCRYQMPEFEIVPSNVEPVPPAAVATRELAGDPGVLSEAEQRLVTRCADAGWMSLCLPNDRRQARALKARADAYEVTRLEVTQLLGQERCDDAVKTALAGGHLGLARQAREFCAPITARPAPSAF